MYQQVVTDIIEWLSCRKFVIKQLVCFPSWMSPVISSISFAWQTFSKAMMERNIECCVNLLWHLCSSLCEILLLFHDITANTSQRYSSVNLRKTPTKLQQKLFYELFLFDRLQNNKVFQNLPGATSWNKILKIPIDG